MEQLTISVGDYSWSTLLVAHFSLSYNLNALKVQEELRERLRDCAGAKGITVERVVNYMRHVYRVVFPNQCIDGVKVTVGMIRETLEELEGEVTEAVRMKECLKMIEKGE